MDLSLKDTLKVLFFVEVIAISVCVTVHFVLYLFKIPIESYNFYYIVPSIGFVCVLMFRYIFTPFLHWLMDI